MKVHVQQKNETAPLIDYPFLWVSTQGCVYLRLNPHHDMICGPKVCDGKLGHTISSYLQPHEAWGRRLPQGSTVVWEQT